MLNWPEPGIYGDGSVSSATRELKKTLADNILTSGYGIEGLLGQWEYLTSVKNAWEGNTSPEAE